MGNFLIKQSIKGDISLNEKLNYTTKYDNKFNNLKEETRDVDDIDNLSNFFVIEYVDKYGNIIINYDSKENKFKYYSDKRVPNEILESISKKYMINSNSKICNKKHVDKVELKTSNTANIPYVYGIKPRKKTKKEVEIIDINKYLNLGKINDFSILDKPIEKQKKLEISYNDYKLIKSIL